MANAGLNLLVPPGFQGLRLDYPLAKYHRNLPHWRQDGATYFVTFRQTDALPQPKLRQLGAIRDEWLRTHPEPRGDVEWELLIRKTMRLVEQWIDEGYGSCRLRDPAAADIMVDALHHFDNVRYELDCYVLMANHVHLLLRPLVPAEFSLESILQSLKSYTARRINRVCNSSGRLWQEESFDRLVRDEGHLWRCIQYIGRNPKNASRSPAECRLWLRPEWHQLGWRFEVS